MSVFAMDEGEVMSDCLGCDRQPWDGANAEELIHGILEEGLEVPEGISDGALPLFSLPPSLSPSISFLLPLSLHLSFAYPLISILLPLPSLLLSPLPPLSHSAFFPLIPA